MHYSALLVHYVVLHVCVYLPNSRHMLTNSRSRLYSTAPLDYTRPPFPSLYWPFNAKPGVANYLYYVSDIWRFTLLWTLIIFAVFHMTAAAFAMLMQVGRGKRAWRYVWAIPLVYSFIAGIEALLAGSFVGLMYACPRKHGRR